MNQTLHAVIDRGKGYAGSRVLGELAVTISAGPTADFLRLLLVDLIKDALVTYAKEGHPYGIPAFELLHIRQTNPTNSSNSTNSPKET